MMKKYCVLVKKIDENVEEEVALDLDGFEVTCFASVCPYHIKEGESYPVYFELTVFDAYFVEESSAKKASLERIKDTFSYWITGKLEGAVLNSLIQFEDEILLSDYGYLDGKFIRIKADRIDVEFLE